MEHSQREQNQNDVREPRLQGGEVETLGYMIAVEKLKNIEMEEIEAVAAFADQEEGAPGEEGRDGVRAA
jgi:hypothetical protein